MIRTLLLILALSCPLMASAARYTPPSYTLTPLPGAAHALNASGTVVGTLQGEDGMRHAYLYKNGSVRRLIEYRPQQSEAWGINDLGEIVGRALHAEDGFYNGPQPQWQPVLWNAEGLFWSPMHGSDDWGAALAINDVHQIAGTYFHSGVNGDVPASFAIFSEGLLSSGFMEGFSGSLRGRANAINNQGVFAGYSQNQFDWPSYQRAVYWENGRVHALAAPEQTDSEAYSVNENDQFAGAIDHHAALWLSLSSLPIISTVADSVAYGLNDQGVAVGEGHGLAFLFAGTEAFRLLPLVTNGAGWNLTRALAINNNGQIVGEGTYQGKLLGFLLTPR